MSDIVNKYTVKMIPPDTDTPAGGFTCGTLDGEIFGEQFISTAREVLLQHPRVNIIIVDQKARTFKQILIDTGSGVSDRLIRTAQCLLTYKDYYKEGLV